VAYDTKDPRQLLDAYILKSETPTPVLVQIHGGGWWRGDKSPSAFFNPKYIYMKALASGISVVSVTYRFAPKWRHPAQVNDVTRAIQFIRSNAKKWNIDPKRIAATGTSAGGHLSSWLGFHDEMADPKSDDPVKRESSRLQAIVPVAAPIDLGRINTNRKKLTDVGKYTLTLYQRLFNMKGKAYNRGNRNKKIIRNASPLFLISPDDPPVFLIYGLPKEGLPKIIPASIDDPHSVMHGMLLEDAFNKHKVVYEKYYMDKPSVWLPESIEKWSEPALKFVIKHLKVQKKKDE